MMVALLLYAYARGNRSARGIERACREDVTYRVICTNLVPDHSTIAEFRCRHETALAELFTSVLSLCKEAGLVSVGVIAIDGTKVKANAHRDANKSYEQIVDEILKEADAIDRAEDEQFGDARGDELPEQLCTPEGRKAALKAAKERLARKRDAAEPDQESDDPERPVVELDREGIVALGRGREGWLRETKKQLDSKREREARPIAKDRARRLLDAAHRLEEEHQAECQAMREYAEYRAGGVMKDGRRFGAPPKPYVPTAEPAGTINTTDPDSRVMKTVGQPGKQGYNAQTAVNEHQIIVAAEVMCRSGDFGNLEPMVDATERELKAIDVTDPVGAVLADAGYFHNQQMGDIERRGTQVLVPPQSRLTNKPRAGSTKGLLATMRERLSTHEGQALYKLRQTLVEPVIGQIKFNRKIDRFQRRGHAAGRSEWRLGAATHNLLKLHNHRIATEGA
jgi:hypothetical protein